MQLKENLNLGNEMMIKSTYQVKIKNTGDWLLVFSRKDPDGIIKQLIRQNISSITQVYGFACRHNLDTYATVMISLLSLSLSNKFNPFVYNS